MPEQKPSLSPCEDAHTAESKKTGFLTPPADNHHAPQPLHSPPFTKDFGGLGEDGDENQKSLLRPQKNKQKKQSQT